MAPAATYDNIALASDARVWGRPLKTNFVPETAHGPLCWEGPILAREDYVVSLTEHEILELEQAAVAYADSGAPLGLISPSTFPLPVLGPKLLELRRRLYDGIGFFVLRGLEPRRYVAVQNTIMFVGLSSYVAKQRAIQYEDGPVLTHVLDLSAKEDLKRNENIYVGQANRNVSLPFHSDDGHVLALYSLHSACKGGRSRLASSWTIYNELLGTRPDIVELLKQPWEWDSFRPEQPKFDRPLLFCERGKIILNFTRRHFLGSPQAPRNPDLAPITAKQHEALDLLEVVAAKHALTFQFQTGDMQFINNLAVMHARESFVNSELTGCRRHLLRLFLKDSERAWPVPQELVSLMNSLYEHEAEDEVFPWSLAPLPYVLTP